MQKALSLAAEGSNGFSAPNPHVGCVIVKNGEVIGEGHSDPAGGAHAEINALKMAGAEANGASVYVTLEPCNHQGRTGPCSQALIRARVAEVVYAVPDPNPIAKGGGEVLSEAGVRVLTGVLASTARHLHRQFLFATTRRRPFVTLKAGVSLDGRIALPSGESKWITSEGSRSAVQKLRAERGCVLIGANTALVDRAKLTVRAFALKNQPTRVVIDSRGALPLSLPVFNDDAPSMRFTPTPSWPMDRPFKSILNVLETLYQEGHTGLLVEGGARTHAAFIKAGVVDEIELFVAPIILGDGPSWVEHLGLITLTEAPSFVVSTVQEVEKMDNNVEDHSNLRITLHSRNLSSFLASE